MVELKNNIAQSRYEIEVEGQVVFSDYRRDGQAISLTHLETPETLRGKGAAGALMQAIAEMAQAEGLKLNPVCPYAAAWLKKHGEYHCLIA